MDRQGRGRLQPGGETLDRAVDMLPRRALLSVRACRHTPQPRHAAPVRSPCPDALVDYREAAGAFSRLAAQFHSVPDYRQLLANTYVNLGQLFRTAKQPREAAKTWQLSIPVLALLAEQFPREPLYRQMLGRSHNELAIASAQQNRPQEAKKAFAEAIQVQEPLVRDFPGNATVWQDLIDTHTNQTSLSVALSQSAEAEKSARDLVAAQQRRLAAFPKSTACQADLARSEKTLADILLANGKAAGTGTNPGEQRGVSPPVSANGVTSPSKVGSAVGTVPGTIGR